MNADGSIPEPLIRFLDVHIESIDQMEILRVLGESPGQSRKVTDLAAEFSLKPADLEAHVAALERRGLIRRDLAGGEPRIGLSPRTPELEATLRQLLQFYRERPVTLIRVIYARAQDRLRAFADAFRLREER